MTSTDVIILGCGTSCGVPSVGADGWGLCDRENPHNRRQRSSAFVTFNGRRYLIDAGPDLRNQLLAHNIQRLEAVLFTHAHADHIAGIDDLRHLQWEHPGRIIDAYGAADHLREIGERFHYCIDREDTEFNALWHPYLRLNAIGRPNGVLPLDPQITTLEIDHHVETCTGWKFGNDFAYCLDCVDITEKTLDALEGIDTWVVDCMREKPHITHAHLDRVLEWVDRIKPRQTILSSLSNAMDYETLSAKLPEGVIAGYDGMKLSITADCRSTTVDA